MYCAVKNSQIETIIELINSELVDLNIQMPSDGNTALHGKTERKEENKTIKAKNQKKQEALKQRK